MLFMGLMISVLIAWATVGLIDKPFIIRFCYASAIMVALNITAYMVKIVRHVKKQVKIRGVMIGFKVPKGPVPVGLCCSSPGCYGL